MEKSDNIGARYDDFGLANSLAAIVRRRWPQDTVKRAEVEWDLTNSEARGVVYATASRSTLDKVIRHKRGRMRLAVEMVALMTGQTLDDFLSSEIEELRKDAEIKNAMAQRLAVAESRLRDRALDSLGVRRGSGGGGPSSRMAPEHRTADPSLRG